MTSEQLPLPLTPGTLVWQLLFWPHPFREQSAIGLLRHWAAQRHAPPLILEARADVTGVEYLIGSPARHAAAVRRTVEQLVGGSVVTGFDAHDRQQISTARRLRLTTTSTATSLKSSLQLSKDSATAHTSNSSPAGANQDGMPGVTRSTRR